MDTDDESLAFRLIAYSLIRHLDLRLDCADAVYFELLSERRLVNDWLRAHSAAQDLSQAIAAAARVALTGIRATPTGT
ncbi:MAG: hypothetical protein EHM87_09140 [Burkholderiales bacterium]|nr:MAG: hypothetical protein EHM87_09140 [Burkholderiales bacterium]